MVNRKAKNNLYDPRSGGESIRLNSLRIDGQPFDPSRTNYFTIYLIESGSGMFWADASRFAFSPNSLLFFVPYQHIRLVPDSPSVFQYRVLICSNTSCKAARQTIYHDAKRASYVVLPILPNNETK